MFIVSLRNKIILTIISLFLAFTSKAFSLEIEAIAQVNNQIITNIDLTERYKFALVTSRIQIRSKRESDIIKRQILEKMIDEELILEEGKQYGFTPSEDEIIKEIKKIAQDQQKSLENFKQFFRANSLSFENYKHQIKSQIVWSKIINEIIAPKLKASEPEVQEAMELRNIDTKITKFHLAEIYLPFNYDKSGEVDVKTLAIKLSDEINDGKDFKNIVKQFSRSPTSENGGDMGWASKNDLAPEIYGVLSEMKIGQTSKPILSNNGYYLLKILDKKITNNNLVDSDVRILKSEILQRKLQVAVRSFMIDLRKKSFVEISRSKI